MRSRKAANDQVAEVARRRLELLSAELAGLRSSLPPDAPPQPGTEGPSGSGGMRGVTGRPPPEPVADPVPSAERPRPARSGRAEASGRHAQRSIGPPGRFGGWLHDRLPPSMQGKVALSPAHVSVVALLVAAAMAVTTWWVLRADGPGTAVPPPASTPKAAGSPLVTLSETPPTPPVPSSAAGVVPVPAPGQSSAPVAAGQVVIDVAGKVREPGITTLPAGSRVADALRSAGGARRGVDLTALNLARVLVDGEQILVGVPAPVGVAPPAAAAPTASVSGVPAQLVNINTADQLALETLPGVGPVTAQAILTWRTENGAFSSVDELLEISGIGDATLAEMAPYVTV